MKADPAIQTVPRFVLNDDGVVRPATARPTSSDGPPDTLRHLGDRVLWLLWKRRFYNPKWSNSNGVNALDAKIGASVGYTTRLVKNSFGSIDPQRLAKIAEVLDTNLEWLVTGRGPWQRMAEYANVPEEGNARWEALRFANVCGFSRGAIRFAETLHWKKRGPAPTAEEWFEIIRLREQQIRAGLLDDEEEAPGREPTPLKLAARDDYDFAGEPDPELASYVESLDAFQSVDDDKI